MGNAMNPQFTQDVSAHLRLFNVGGWFFMIHQSTTKIKWSKKENDYKIDWDKDHQCNAGFINDHILDKSFLQELRERGYDLDTLKFEIKKFAS